MALIFGSRKDDTLAGLPIQIVDEQDNPVGQADTLEAQEKGLIHRIARIMVQDEHGRLLLQKRSSKMRRWPNCWDNSAAGHVDVGEDYATAAARELAEEIGVRNVKLTEVDTYYTDRPLGRLRLRRFNRLYKAIANDNDITIDPAEVAEVKWFTIEEAKELIKEQPDQITDGLADVIQRYY